MTKNEKPASQMQTNEPARRFESGVNGAQIDPLTDTDKASLLSVEDLERIAAGNGDGNATIDHH